MGPITMGLSPDLPGSSPAPATRLRLSVRGLVQGVGFRPTVYRLATGLGLRGFVLNTGAGVVIEVEGARAGEFAEILRHGAPPRAHIEALETHRLAASGRDEGFRIIDSDTAAPGTTRIGPDTAPCPSCLSELFDPADRRYRHPFIACCDCGPRHTIAGALPYDRARTAMGGFALCAACAADYADPASRRFHAELTACPDCGPRLTLDPADILREIRAGAIVALKGLGGFQLICDASQPAPVERLRRGKRRDAKPFALLVASLTDARALCDVRSAEAEALTSPERPIVLLHRRADARPPLAAAIAPGLDTLGVMLPVTPLQYLIFHEAAGRPAGTAWLDQPTPLVLVATSANRAGAPLILEGAEVAAELGADVDVLADHDRPILARADDGVVRVLGDQARSVRRGRGQTPEPIVLGRALPPVLALGAQWKNSVCVTRGDRAFLSQHIGDLDSRATLAFQRAAIDQLMRFVDTRPVVVAHDLHPDFASSRLAEAMGLPTIAIQHHHAHLAAVAAEHHIDGPLVGLALDGFGLGDDGGAWGGELLRLDGDGFVRLGHLAPLALPGGDAAARQPWRMAASALARLGRGDEIVRRFAHRPEAGQIAALLARPDTLGQTTSCGRWFDAAAGLLGLCDEVRYEGEAAMRLEALAASPRIAAEGWRISQGVLDLLPLLDRLSRLDAGAGAGLFHGTLVAALVDWALPAIHACPGARVALAGGCLINRSLAEGLITTFAARGITALLPRQSPANDGGLALGQAYLAGLRWLRLAKEA
ncbi:carbamoyltransferase HypF [Rhodospirillum rubrum]|uniref:Carbamoyltransferase HypF n=1 Tax=Rhodospirillum rubrum (strain ATCC 11170 / ATH 1.1.1 / DSM 467 / LMG 4362 / NCIMB 8255 / S1) TaxID=269796 RepID=Q2RXN2_RHORT|nr:carbamoyltransferase HypF [Rhodospirillum rubrum]ABC21113.1 Hydrogenase maturation protein HypF [Rhodospirillum rubrum ATCC 11170]AEO46781.1 hydrogenase maturation protein HypF [Rhodospirillum rubrum F11]MBK5952660.1 hydrogenase maturation protein HypF [Rhodospirillum rubrum]QXG80805.1 carbamoyltransferase HypF [Rhodospirillum rubrum]HAQ00275.1 carbamoyltransferase HypF [Rhodospirillum rubrum]